ncbi:MAG: ATP-binding protein [Flavobacterium sp.]|nr:ATP-binding protein [Flavobacterium sp.]
MQIQTKEIITLIIVITCIFLIAGIFLLLYVALYNRKKRKHVEEKETMEIEFKTELIKTQMEVQEETLQTLAADLHNNIGQLLSLTNVTLASVNIDNDSKAQQKIIAAKELITRSINELRQLSKLLHGEQLIQQGLPKAIEQEVNWLQKGGYYTVHYLNLLDESVEINKDKALFLYRLLQEAINNIIKHAEATVINITLQLVSNQLCLTITDNGNGFNTLDPDITQHGLGLHTMQRRIDLLNGKVHVTSEIGIGTTVSLTLPNPF